MLVEDAMIRNVITIEGPSYLRDAAQLIISSGISGVPVVDKEKQLLGVLSERDIILALDLLGLEVEICDVMNPSVVSVSPDQSTHFCGRP